METENQESIFQEFENQIDSNGKEALLSASKWGKILAILYFVLAGIAILFLLGTSVFSFMASSYANSFLGSVVTDNAAVVIIFALILGFLIVLLLLQLLRFGSKVKQGVEHESTELVEQGFGNLRVYLVVSGIFSILMVIGGLFKLIM